MTTIASESDHLARLREIVREWFPALRTDLENLVRIPGVSAPTYPPAPLQASAKAVAQLLRRLGVFDEVHVLRAPKPDGELGAPAVVARRMAPEGAPTVLLYAHHDVQPPGTGWHTEPFEPTVQGGRMYGRGAADDKAGIVAHVGALRALLTAGGLPKLGITIWVEGEEEDGSPSFRNFLDRYRDLLAADVIVVADSANWRVGVPALTTSLRGLVSGYLEVAVLEHAVHSGFFGGPLLDSYTLLAMLIASMYDAAGNLIVEGLSAAAEPAVDYGEAQFRADSSLLPGTELAGSGSIAGRLWAKPALAVVGIDGPDAEHGTNVIAPSARAKLALRIPPGQDPAAAAEALSAHVAAHAPFGSRATWTTRELGRPFQAPADSAPMRAARAAFAQAWGTEPVDIGVGGSIPFIADLKEFFPEAAILVTGVEDPDSRAHGANESVHLGELQNAILAEALLLESLADVVNLAE